MSDISVTPVEAHMRPFMCGNCGALIARLGADHEPYAEAHEQWHKIQDEKFDELASVLKERR